jgi:hypothetical protein
MLSLLRLKNAHLMLPPNTQYSGPQNDLNRELLPLPECILEDWDTPIENVLRPAFNALYQSAGMPRSFNHDKDGNWNGQEIAFH